MNIPIDPNQYAKVKYKQENGIALNPVEQDQLSQVQNWINTGGPDQGQYANSIYQNYVAQMQQTDAINKAQQGTQDAFNQANTGLTNAGNDLRNYTQRGLEGLTGALNPYQQAGQAGLNYQQDLLRQPLGQGQVFNDAFRRGSELLSQRAAQRGNFFSSRTSAAEGDLLSNLLSNELSQRFATAQNLGAQGYGASQQMGVAQFNGMQGLGQGLAGLTQAQGQNGINAGIAQGNYGIGLANAQSQGTLGREQMSQSFAQHQQDIDNANNKRFCDTVLGGAVFLMNPELGAMDWAKKQFFSGRKDSGVNMGETYGTSDVEDFFGFNNSRSALR